tara:strand:- start:79 stop:993 length:915 start_codon:yes stop_codon:yes gene_type:complete
MTKLLGKVLVLGEVLFDVFEDERKLGGAPFNFSYHLHHLGIPTTFVSRVGRDKMGLEILDFIKKQGWLEGGLQIDPEKPTGEARVSPYAFGGPRFEILIDRAWDYIENGDFLESLETPSLIYFGTLAQRGSVSRQTIIKYLKNKKDESTVFLDLNLREPFYDFGIVENSLSICDILKVNARELDVIRSLLDLDYYFGTNSLVDHLHREYDIAGIYVTRGDQGCEFYERGEPIPLKQPASLTDEFQDSVGAGDAFSAVLALGTMRKWEAEVILARASLFASKICTIKGSLPSTLDFYTFSRSFDD